MEIGKLFVDPFFTSHFRACRLFLCASLVTLLLIKAGIFTKYIKAGNVWVPIIDLPWRWLGWKN